MTARILVALALVLALLLALGAAAAWLFRQGGQSVIHTIERQNHDAAATADKARFDYDRCIDGGGMFDFATGQCSRPARRGRN